MCRSSSSRTWRIALCGVLLSVVTVSLPGCDQSPAGGENRTPGGGENRTPEVARQRTPSSNCVVVTDANFEKVTRSGIVLIDFWAAWCAPCVKQGPVVEKIAEQYAGRVVVGKLDVGTQGKNATRLGIQFIPTLIVFKNGREVQRLTGLQSERKLQTTLAAVLEGD